MFSENDAHGKMLTMIFHARILAQVVKCVAEFSLADHLSGEPRSPESVAEAAGLDPEATRRLLRYCSVVGLALAEGDGRYRQTPLLTTLRSEDPLSLRSFAMAQNGPGQWAVLSRLNQAFRTGLPQAEAALGSSLYEYYGQSQHAEDATAYRQGLAGRNTAIAREFAAAIDTDSISSALDVGGSTGSMVLTLMESNSSLHGAVLDLPSVAQAAAAEAQRRGAADRFQFIAGDFFETVPASDLYILKHVLGNWPDEACLTILRNCRAFAARGSRIYILENMMDDMQPSRWSVDIDLITMVAVGGKTRTLQDYQRLLESADFHFTKLLKTSSPVPVAILEAACA